MHPEIFWFLQNHQYIEPIEGFQEHNAFLNIYRHVYLYTCRKELIGAGQLKKERVVHGCFFVVQQPPVESDTAMIRVNLHGDCFFF